MGFFLQRRSYPIHQKRRDGLKAAPWQNFPMKQANRSSQQIKNQEGANLAPQFFREAPKFAPQKVPLATLPTTRTAQTSTNLATNPPRKQPDFLKNSSQSKVDSFTLTLRGEHHQLLKVNSLAQISPIKTPPQEDNSTDLICSKSPQEREEPRVALLTSEPV